MEILLHYRQLFVKGNVIIGEWSIFGVEIFLHYSQFFVKGDFDIGGVECNYNINIKLNRNYVLSWNCIEYYAFAIIYTYRP